MVNGLLSLKQLAIVLKTIGYLKYIPRNGYSLSGALMRVYSNQLQERIQLNRVLSDKVSSFIKKNW